MEAGTLTRPTLCRVTDGTLAPGDPLEEAAAALRAAAGGGIDLIQIRERGVDDATLLSFVRQTIEAVSGTPTRIVVNDRVDVAIAAGAAGVHLRGDSYAAADVRAIAPQRFVIGRSVHSIDEAVAVERAGGLDYLIFGTVFPSARKPPHHPVAGLEALAGLCRAVTLPVLAIGGMTVERAPAVAATGAAGIAAIGLFGGAGPDAVQRDIVQQVRRAWS